jgi:hypothetical protein
VIKSIQENNFKVDIFTFVQRVTQTQPLYDYYYEWDNIAAIKLHDYNYWWEKQISHETRKAVRKSQKNGVTTQLVDFNDELAKGIEGIFNETPIRQGRPFWHYGKDVKSIKKLFSRDAEYHDFIGAYYNDELIGFIMFRQSGSVANLGQIISKIRHRDKAPTNALLSKAVEVCCTRGLKYLVYGNFEYRKGGANTLTDFKRHNGFDKIDIPRYYIPLSRKGNIVLLLKLHKGFKEKLPETVIGKIKSLRSRWYSLMLNKEK